MPYRALTTGELTLAKSVFGNAIDYTRVKLYDSRVLPAFLQTNNRAFAYLNKISFPGTAYSADFSLEDPVRQSLFIHELVHVWQYQNKVLDTRTAFAKDVLRHPFNISARYAYRLKDGRDLKKYGMEPQACIIQDYFLLSRFGNVKSHRDSRQNDVSENLLDLYKSVLKNFAQNPAYLRKPRFK